MPLHFNPRDFELKTEFINFKYACDIANDIQITRNTAKKFILNHTYLIER